LLDLIECANVRPANVEGFSIPGSCWNCDYDWILDARCDGDRVRPLLERDVVLRHSMRLALAMNPMILADKFNVPASTLAKELTAILTLECLGG